MCNNSPAAKTRGSIDAELTKPAVTSLVMKGTQILRTTEKEDRINQWMNKYRRASAAGGWGWGVARGHCVNAGWEYC